MQPPLRQMSVHERNEGVVVMALDQMHEFVDDGFGALLNSLRSW